MDVVPILTKIGVPVEQVRIEVDADQATEHPRVLTSVRLRDIVSGRGVRPEQVKHAVALS